MFLARVATDDALVLATTTDDERRLLRATVLRTQKQRFLHIVTTFLQRDGDATLAARVVGTSPLSRLAQGVVQTLTFMDDDVATESVTRY